MSAVCSRSAGTQWSVGRLHPAGGAVSVRIQRRVRAFGAAEALKVLRHQGAHPAKHGPATASVAAAAAEPVQQLLNALEARFAGHRSQVTGHGSQVTGHGSQVTGHRSQVMDPWNKVVE